MKIVDMFLIDGKCGRTHSYIDSRAAEYDKFTKRSCHQEAKMGQTDI